MERRRGQMGLARGRSNSGGALARDSSGGSAKRFSIEDGACPSFKMRSIMRSQWLSRNKGVLLDQRAHNLSVWLILERGKREK